MHRVEVDLEPAIASAERSVDRFENRKLNRNRHQHRNKDGEGDRQVDDRTHSSRFHPRLTNDEKVSDESDEDRKTEIVESDKNVEKVNAEETSGRSDEIRHRINEIARDVVGEDYRVGAEADDGVGHEEPVDGGHFVVPRKNGEDSEVNQNSEEENY